MDREAITQASSICLHLITQVLAALNHCLPLAGQEAAREEERAIRCIYFLFFLGGGGGGGDGER